MKVLFLPGIGDGIVKSTWTSALSGALAEHGYPSLDLADVLAPQYATPFET